MENETPAASSTNSGPNKLMYALIGLSIVILLGVVGFIFMNRTTPQTTPESAQTEPTQPVTQEQNVPDSDTEEMVAEEEPSGTMTNEGSPSASEVTQVTIDAKNFSFTPSQIKVKQGTTVKVTLNITQGFHDFVIDEFDVKTKQIQGPATETVEFVASKKGTFEFYCSVGNHRAQGMVGTLIVE